MTLISLFVIYSLLINRQLYFVLVILCLCVETFVERLSNFTVVFMREESRGSKVNEE